MISSEAYCLDGNLAQIYIKLSVKRLILIDIKITPEALDEFLRELQDAKVIMLSRFHI